MTLLIGYIAVGTILGAITAEAIIRFVFKRGRRWYGSVRVDRFVGFTTREEASERFPLGPVTTVREER